MDKEIILKDLYKKIKNCNKRHKSGILFLIIQIKHESNDLKNFKQTIYKDIKYFVKFYIKASEKRDFGYDDLNIGKIEKVISCSSNVRERYQLMDYTIRLMNLFHFEDINILIRYKNKLKTELLKENKSLHGKIKLISHLSSYNLNTIILILLSIFILYSVVLLPAFNDSFAILTFNYSDFSNIFIWNHFLNIVAVALEIGSNDSIEPINSMGVIVLSIFKSLYIVLIFNYLYQKSLRIIYEN